MKLSLSKLVYIIDCSLVVKKIITLRKGVIWQRMEEAPEKENMASRKRDKREEML